MSEVKSWSDQELDQYVICPKCNTLYQKVTLSVGKRATCKHCDTILYRNDPRYLNRALALSITGGILFIVANAFPLIRINLLGVEKTMNVIEVISQLISSGYYVVAISVLFLVLIIPAMMIVLYIVLLLMMHRRQSEELTRDLLVLLSRLIPWNMADIFLVSILVALVKLVGHVQIHFGISFWALLLYVGIDIYLTKARRIGYLWGLRTRIYHHA